MAGSVTTDAESSTSSDSSPVVSDFGANEWLVEDMYERYQADPSSVDAAWHDFFADYRPAPAAAQERLGTGEEQAEGRAER
jgi:2-oxoglutarate dehydrogenase complex dehydrogenase (E1) component-like enzyme